MIPLYWDHLLLLSNKPTRWSWGPATKGDQSGWLRSVEEQWENLLQGILVTTILQPCCGFTLDFTTLLKPSTMKLFDKNAIPPAALKPTSPIGTWSFPKGSLVFSKRLVFFSSYSPDNWKQPSWSHHTPSILVDGGMHAREWVTVGTALSLVGHLVEAYCSLITFTFFISLSLLQMSLSPLKLPSATWWQNVIFMIKAHVTLFKRWSYSQQLRTVPDLLWLE